MNQVLQDRLAEYTFRTLDDYDRALKEIIQEICLLGLWRAKFFEQAAFYGGTALRLLYGLDRFSEDIDFSLLEVNKSFQLSRYFSAVENELLSFGFEVDITGKGKSTSSAIESAFIKANTRIHYLKVGIPPRLVEKVPSNRLLKVKFEIDNDPPPGFKTETKYLLWPISFSVRAFSPSDLFAGKVHALLYRRWQHRVKGRDWYDLVWFVRKCIPLSLRHLSFRMHQSGDLPEDVFLEKEEFRQCLIESIQQLDIEQARTDVTPFLDDRATLDVWSKDFFLDIAERINYE